jgi:hypothetical protein
MRSQSAARFHVVKKDEKEGRLTEFIRRHLVGHAAGPPALPSEFLLVARSVRSPVVQALQALTTELGGAGLGVRAVLLEPFEAGAPHEGALRSIRLLREMRALEAHEQLVLGPATAWIGDCMRREPELRDAFEAYAEACPLTACWALRSFQALWRRATPMLPVALSGACAEAPSADLAASALSAAAEPDTPSTAASRN